MPRSDSGAANLRHSLLARRDQAICQLSALDPVNGHGRSYEPMLNAERDARAIRRSQLRAEVLAVERALERIKDGTFGICGVCDHPIDPARLKAVPTVETCVPCARLADIRRGDPTRRRLDDDEEDE